MSNTAKEGGPAPGSVPTVTVPSMLDLCAGLGGASQAMRERGWRVVRVDLDPRFKPDVVADVRALPPLGRFDLAWASPPCQEFSTMNYIRGRGINPSSEALAVAKAAARAAQEHGRWWVVENVRGAIPFFEPFLGRPRRVLGAWVLWGNFPMFDTPRTLRKMGAQAKSREALAAGVDNRAKRLPAAVSACVPPVISRALALGCEHALQGALA